MSEESGQEKTFFDPPLWMQRRVLIGDLLRRHDDVHSILELGCGEGNVLGFFCGDPMINQLVGIDIKEDLLHIAHYRLKPTDTDHEEFMLREAPLKIELYCGSILNLDKCVIERKEFDACICTEVIEHLYPEDLDKFAKSLFQVLKPKLLVLTTPNSEFNTLFPLKEGETRKQFRDDDHKFEWTRKEFQDWCHEAIKIYANNGDYEVEFGGVGLFTGSKYDDSFGYCSQSACFVRKGSLASKIEASGQFKHIASIEYPYFEDKSLTDEMRFEEVKGWIITFLKWKECNISEEKEAQISYEKFWRIHRLRQIFAGNFKSMVKLMRSLGDENWKDEFVIIPKDSSVWDTIRENTYIIEKEEHDDAWVPPNNFDADGERWAEVDHEISFESGWE